MKKKILIFSLAYYPKHIGGAEVAIKQITDRISPEKYEFHMVCNHYDTTLLKKEKIGNVIVHRIGFATASPTMTDLRKFPLHLNKVWYQWQAFWFARKLHRQEKFAGIWAMMAHATGVPAGKFKQVFPDVKYILTLQEGDPPAYIEQKMKWFGSAFDRAFTKADTIQVISTFLGNWAKAKGFAGEPILIPNGVNITQFTQNYPIAELKAVRQSHGVKDNDTLLVTTSRLVYKNGLDEVIKSLADLPEAVKFLIFGIGPEEQKLRELILKKKLVNRVFLLGEISHDLMPKYLKACDIFIRPSRSEGMGNSFIEAMAAGLPVIATQVGGIKDFLFDARRNPDKETTGWAVAVDNAEQIAEAVRDIMANPEKVSEVTSRAKAMVVKKYDWDLIATRMENEVFKVI